MQPNSSCLTRIVRCLHCRSLLRRAMFSPVSCFAKKPIGRTPLHSSPAFNLYTNAKLKLSLRTRLGRHAHARFMHFLDIITSSKVECGITDDDGTLCG